MAPPETWKTGKKGLTEDRGKLIIRRPLFLGERRVRQKEGLTLGRLEELRQARKTDKGASPI